MKINIGNDTGEQPREEEKYTPAGVALWPEIYSQELVRWEIYTILRIKFRCHLIVKVTSASGNEEQAIANQIARAVYHLIVLYVLFIYMLLFSPLFQMHPEVMGEKSQYSVPLDKLILWNSGQGAYGNSYSEEQTLHSE